MSDKLLERIGALLAKAESTDSPHEAEALTAKAQELATLHAIDIGRARAEAGRRRRRSETPTQRKLVIGNRNEPGRRHRVHLFLAVSQVNDVRLDVARDSTYVLAFGFPTDLAVTEALYSSLATQMVAAANGAIRRGEHRREVYWSEAAGAWRSDARVFRSAFNTGFVTVVAERLRQARNSAVAKAAATPAMGVQPSVNGAMRGAGRQTTGALVLAGKAQEVDAFYRNASSARGTWRGGAQRPVAWSDAGHSAGRRAGRSAQIFPSGELPGAPEGLPREAEGTV